MERSIEDQFFHPFWGSKTENCQTKGSQGIIPRNIDYLRLILVNGI